MSAPVIIGNATLFHDTAENVLQSLGGGLDGCMDPPYVFNASGGGSFRYGRKCLDRIQEAGLTDGFDHGLITAAQFRSVVVFCHNDQLAELVTYLGSLFKRVAVCAWHKSNPMPVCNKHYVPDTEFWVHAWNSGAAPVGAPKQLARYWIGPTGKQAVYDHPTVKPLDLMLKIVTNIGGDTIVDPFMGTGTTGAAALIRGRKFIGIEKDKRFFEMACDRIARVYRDGLAKMPEVAA